MHDAENDHSAELPGEQRGSAQRCQREAVEEAGLDVTREIGACVHRREQRALDERHREREGDEGVRREPRQVRLRT